MRRDCHLNQVAPNHRNPHTFYWCLATGPVLMKCVDSLVFEPSLRKCVSRTEQATRRRQILRREISRKPSKHVGLPEPNTMNVDYKATIEQPLKSLPPKPTVTQLVPPTHPVNSIVQKTSNSTQKNPAKIEKPVAQAIPEKAYEYSICPENFRYGLEAPTIYAQNRFNCSQFFSCSNGRAVLQECPHGLYFNPMKTVSVCDYPRNVPSCRMVNGYASLRESTVDELETTEFVMSPLAILQSLS